MTKLQNSLLPLFQRLPFLALSLPLTFACSPKGSSQPIRPEATRGLSVVQPSEPPSPRNQSVGERIASVRNQLLTLFSKKNNAHSVALRTFALAYFDYNAKLKANANYQLQNSRSTAAGALLTIPSPAPQETTTPEPSSPEVNQALNNPIIASIIEEQKRLNSLLGYATGVNVRAWGAKGDGLTDDTEAIQSALFYAQLTKTRLYLPKGEYLLSSTLALTSSSATIQGESRVSTQLKCNAASSGFNSFFQFTDEAQNNRFDFLDFSMHGQSKVNYGVYSERLAHAIFRSVQVIATNKDAISIGYGWNNSFHDVELSFNRGNGLHLSVNNNNSILISGCKFFLNDGFGLLCDGGSAINIDASTFETNKKGGIYFRSGAKGVSINSCYFEANAQDGYALESPRVNIKTDILINGSANPKSLSAVFPCEGISVRNATFSPLTGGSASAVWAQAVNGLTLDGNILSHGVNIPLVASCNDALIGRISKLVLGGNQNFSKLYDPQMDSSNYTLNSSDWTFPSANIIETRALNLSSVLSGSVATQSLPVQVVGFKAPAFEIKSTGSSSILGESILPPNVSSNGFLVRLIASASGSSGLSGLALVSGKPGSFRYLNNSVASDNLIKPIGLIGVLPAAGTMIGVRKIGNDGTSATIIDPQIQIIRQSTP